MDYVLVLVEIPDKFYYSAPEVEYVLPSRVFIRDFYGDVWIKKGKFAHSGNKYLIIELARLLENFRIGFEPYFRTCIFCFSYDLKWPCWFTSPVGLTVYFPVSVNLYLKIFGKGIYHGDSNTVESA